MTLEPFQIEAAKWLGTLKRGVLVAPAGVGKTIILSAAIDMVLRSKTRDSIVQIGWMANTIEQCQQARDAMGMFPSIAALAEVYTHCAAAEMDWSGMDLLICDEVHHLGAQSWISQVSKCQGCIWGMTATPETGDTERDAALMKFFHGNVFTVDRAASSNRLVSARVIMLDASDDRMQERIDAEIQRLIPIRTRQFQWCRKPMDEHEIYRMCSWQACVELGIVGNTARNAKAVEMAMQHADKHVLVLINYVDHAKTLALEIGPHAVPCFSKMGKKARIQAMDDFRSGEKKCLVASSLADEGLDLPMIEILILVSGGRSNVKTEQRTGRALRTFAGKTEATIYDFLDSFHPMMASHARKRMALYRKLGYEVQL